MKNPANQLKSQPLGWINQTVVILLNWNEHGVSSKSFERLLAEKVPVVFVDNGSTNPKDVNFVNLLLEAQSKESHPGSQGFRVVNLPTNQGSCLARNAGIQEACEVFDADKVFLLDGDILYVPGSVEAYSRALEALPVEYVCIGRHDQQQFFRDGHNGTLNLRQAATGIPSQLVIQEGFPMAWTQYGLFRTSALNALSRGNPGPFPTDPPFDGPGHGYEDDWLYNLMLEAGHKVAHTTWPLYYHQASSGPRELAKSKAPLREDERRAAFEQRFGSEAGWRNRLGSSAIRTIMTLSLAEP